MNTPKTFFEDEDFQDGLVFLLCRDIKALQECASLLSADDFKPLGGMRSGRSRWITAERALEHWRKFHEPINRLLKADLLEYGTDINLNPRAIEELREYATKLYDSKPNASGAIIEKVVRFKRERIKAASVQELSELQSSGMLTDEKWLEISRKALAQTNGKQGTVDFLSTAQDRVERRKQQHIANRIPWLFIDPCDEMIRCVGPGELGLVLAPYKRGKSLLLLWIAVAYVIQRLQVLYITLEDSENTVEDRLDSIVTRIPIKSLVDHPKLFQRQFTRFRSMVSRQLKIYDGTAEIMTVAQLEQIILTERDNGFFPDAVVIDYDAKIRSASKGKERRFEFEEVYGDILRMGSRYHHITWTAAQTQRDTETLKIISGDRAGEAILKLQMATMALSIGKGDWGDNSLFLWVAAHKNDKKHVGVHIIPDLSRSLIYDRDATLKAERQFRGKVQP